MTTHHNKQQYVSEAMCCLFQYKLVFFRRAKMYKKYPVYDDVACIQNSHARRIT